MSPVWEIKTLPKTSPILSLEIPPYSHQKDIEIKLFNLLIILNNLLTR